MDIGGGAALLAWFGLAWLLVGGLTGLVFLLVGIERVDPAARGAYAMRPLLLPGLALLWPLVLWRWRELARDGAAGRG